MKFLTSTLLCIFLACSFSSQAQIISGKKRAEKSDKVNKKGKNDTSESENSGGTPVNLDIDAEAVRFLDSLGVTLGGKENTKDGEKSGLIGGFNPFNSTSKVNLDKGDYTEPEPIALDFETANEYRSYLIRKSNNILADKPGIAIKAAADRYQLQALRNAKGNELLFQGYYDHAFYVFNLMLGTDPNLKGVQFNAGYAILKGYGDPKRAIPYLKSAVLNTTYKPNIPFFEMAPTEAIYWLGVAYHRLGDIEEAERKYKLFLSVVKPKTPFYFEANLGLDQIDAAKKLIVNPGNGKVINAESINTPYSDIAAHTYNYNGSLIFASARVNQAELTDTSWFHTKEGRAGYDIYTAERNVYLEWENPKKVTTVSDEFDDYPISISQDGSQLNLFQGRYNNSDIFKSNGTNGDWNIEGRVFANQQSQAWSPFVAISPDGKMAIFAANIKDDTYGGLDLYVVKQDDYGQWTDPVNLGERINSPLDETTPAFHPNGKSIFFSSNGPASMGGFDVFKSDIEETGIFSVPTNMKPPINSYFDDIYFSYGADGSYGFLSRNGGKLNKGDFDIYEINFKAINFSLNQSEDRAKGLGNQTISTNGTYVQVNNLLSKTAERIAKSDRTGKFYVILQPCTSYRITYIENGTKKSEETFGTPCNLNIDERKLELSPYDFGKIEATLRQRGMRKALASEYSKNGNDLKWQVMVDDVPYAMPNKEVNLLSSDGTILKSFKTDYQGRFDFSLIPNSVDYNFSVQVAESDICNRLTVVLKRADIMLQDYTYPVKQCFK